MSQLKITKKIKFTCSNKHSKKAKAIPNVAKPLAVDLIFFISFANASRVRMVNVFVVSISLNLFCYFGY
jgi:hypothetical protein